MNWEMHYDLPAHQRSALMSLKTTLMLTTLRNGDSYSDSTVERICSYGAANPELIDLMTEAAQRGASDLEEMKAIMAEMQEHHVAVRSGAL